MSHGLLDALRAASFETFSGHDVRVRERYAPTDHPRQITRQWRLMQNPVAADVSPRHLLQFAPTHVGGYAGLKMAPLSVFLGHG